MGNRSRFVALGAAASGAALLSKRRRDRRKAFAEGIEDAILPTHGDTGLPSDRGPVADEAHAPGHQHRPLDRQGPAPAGQRGRPWKKPDHGDSLYGRN